MQLRVIAARALGAAVGLLAGGGPVQAADLPASPATAATADASFAARCAELAFAQTKVSTAPFTFEHDDTQSMAELTAKSGSTSLTHGAIALTTAVFTERTRIEMPLVTTGQDGWACGAPDVHVALSMQPVVVCLASELAETTCQREVALQHEMKHVTVFRQALAQAANDLERALPDVIGPTLCYAASPEQLQRQVHGTVHAYLWRFMREQQDALDVLQAEVDSRDEYARVHDACAHDDGDR